MEKTVSKQAVGLPRLVIPAFVQNPRFGQPIVTKELHQIGSARDDDQVSGHRARAAQVEPGLAIVVIAALIIAIVEAHGDALYARGAWKGTAVGRGRRSEVG